MSNRWQTICWLTTLGDSAHVLAYEAGLAGDYPTSC